MVSELDFVNSKPKKVLAYLKILARTACEMDPKEDIKLSPSKEDLILARERVFREKVEQNIKAIESNISKTLYHLHSKMNKAKDITASLRQGQSQKAVLQRKVGSVVVVPEGWAMKHTLKLEEMHKVKQKLRLLEEKSLWLSNKGYDSEQLRNLQQRIDKAKEMLYTRLSVLLDSVEQEKPIRHVPASAGAIEHLALGSVIGNLANGKFHRPACSSAKAMSKDNRLVLENESVAKKKGFKACSLCFPK